MTLEGIWVTLRPPLGHRACSGGDGRLESTTTTAHGPGVRCLKMADGANLLHYPLAVNNRHPATGLTQEPPQWTTPRLSPAKLNFGPRS